MSLAERSKTRRLPTTGLRSRLELLAADSPVRFAVGVVIVSLVVVGVLSRAMPVYWTILGTTAVASMLLTASIGILYARANMLSLCPLSFAAAAAWLAGWLAVRGDANYLLLIPLAMLIAAVGGLLVGLLALRLRGMNLAVATIAVASATTVLLAAKPIPGLVTGDPVPRPGFAQDDRSYFFFCAAIVIVAFTVLAFVLRSRLGSAWSMLANERAAAAGGTNVLFAKLTAFAVSAALAALSGVLTSGQQGLVDSSIFSVGQNFQIVVVAIFVGAGYLEGAVLSGIVPVVLGEIFLDLDLPTDVPIMLFGVGAVQILAQNPSGVSGSIRAKRRYKRAKAAAAAAERTARSTERPAKVLS